MGPEGGEQTFHQIGPVHEMQVQEGFDVGFGQNAVQEQGRLVGVRERVRSAKLRDGEVDFQGIPPPDGFIEKLAGGIADVLEK